MVPPGFYTVTEMNINKYRTHRNVTDDKDIDLFAERATLLNDTILLNNINKETGNRCARKTNGILRPTRIRV